MKFILLGTLSEGWAGKQAERVNKARDKLKQLGIALDSVYYTQGRYDFIDTVEAVDAEAVLAFSLWYANAGLGRIETLPAFDMTAFQRVARRALKKK
jgi:uncharacterized protein with GYD domain